MFQPQKSTPVRVNRQQHNCVTLTHSNSMFKNSVQFYSNMLWNSLPLSIKEIVKDDIPKLSYRGSITEWILNKRKDSFLR